MNKIMNRSEILSAISIIPESAPFNPEQRAWLNGFFAGMTGIEELAATQGSDTNLNGSVSLADPQDEEEFPWHDDTLSIDERLELAQDKPVERQMMAAMAQLDCGSCGYLCRSYSEAIASGEESNLTLCTPGGKETAKTLKRLFKLNAEIAPTLSSNSASVGKAEAEGYSRKNPFPATLIRSERLTGQGSAKDVRHVEIDLSGSNLSYEVGDALGLYPTNCSALVEQILFHCNTEVDTRAAHESLMTRDLASVTDELCECIAAAVTDDVDRKRVNQLTEDDDQLDELDVLDMLQLFDSVRLTETQLISSLPELNPRLYSIASSLKTHPEQVHLTVGKVTYTKNERLRKGVASTLLAERVDVGTTLRVFTQTSHGFTIPTDDKAPMIMIGPGTGIAPFIAFLQEREFRNAPGQNWLFFGDQRSETDFLYRDQLSNYLESGRLTRLDTAFSRDQDHKVYVQDRMRENAAELFAWLKTGASFYVCGDASRMAKDVNNALFEIVQQQGNMSESAAKSFITGLKENGRYMRDVY